VTLQATNDGTESGVKYGKEHSNETKLSEWVKARTKDEGKIAKKFRELIKLLRPEEPGRWVTAEGPEREDGLDLLG
jgi:hypothetical protein